jgi:CheY-like chemotaxis protein
MHTIERAGNPNTIVVAVKDLMARNGVTDRQQSKKLSEILNLSYSQAHRKLNAGVDWTVNQLQVVAEYFGESLAAMGLGADDNCENIAQRAVLLLGPGSNTYPCLAWIGDALNDAAKVDFVAVKNGDEWHVVEAARSHDKTSRYRVEKLEIVVRHAPAPAIAVVDDEQEFADNLCEYLNESGFEAEAFYSPAALERAMEQRAYDGYVIDWILGDRTAETLIRKIRDSMSAVVPIYLLTGEVVTGLVEESEAARVIKQLDVQWKEKPIRLATFTAELQKSLGA